MNNGSSRFGRFPARRRRNQNRFRIFGFRNGQTEKNRVTACNTFVKYPSQQTKNLKVNFTCHRSALQTGGAALILAVLLVLPAWMGSFAPCAEARAETAAAQARPHIYYPHGFYPAIVKSGDPIPAAFTIPEGAKVESAFLAPDGGGDERVELDMKRVGEDNGRDKYTLAPRGFLFPGAYSLEINYTSKTKRADGAVKFEDMGDGQFSFGWDPTGDDGEAEAERGGVVRERAVWVVDGFKENFRFAILSDYHVGDDRGKKIAKKFDFSKVRAKVLARLAAEKPEFVLILGDILYAPNTYERDFAIFHNELSGAVAAPMFLVPGNHDLMKFVVPRIWSSDGMELWNRYFGPLYFSFSYGRHRFIGMNTWDWTEKSRDFSNAVKDKATIEAASGGAMRREQFEWIQEQLRDAAAAGQTVSVFGHHEPTGDMNAKSVLGSEKLVAPAAFLETLRSNGVRYYFYGHRHDNSYDVREPMELICTSSSGSDLNSAEGWGFRMVEVTGDKYSSTYIEVEPNPKKK